MKPTQLFLVAAASTPLLTHVPAQASDFTYGYQNVNAAYTDTYVVGLQNARKYTEWQTPPATYYGPSANDVQGLLTYRFDFSAPTAAISLKATTQSFNFPSRGDYGYSSMWGSTDGASWQLIQDNPLPASSGPAVASNLFYNQALPGSFLGASSFWLQVRMFEHAANPDGQPPTTSWADAQFSRYDTNRPGNLFQLDVTLAPEPGSITLVGLGLASLILRRRRD